MFAAKKPPCDAINTALKASASKILCNVRVKATFNRRETSMDYKILTLFTSEFKTDPGKQSQWQAFLTKNNLATNDSFALTIEKIEALLGPVCENANGYRLINKKRDPLTWNSQKWNWQ